MKLAWSEPAVASLQAIHDFIARDSQNRAAAFVGRLVLAAEALLDLPMRGRVVPELGRQAIRELLLKNYRIVYRLEDERVVILAVLHAARDPGRFPLSDLETD